MWVEIVESVRVSEESLAGQGDTVLALIVNRVLPSALEAVGEALAVRGDGAPPVWALPEDDASAVTPPWPSSAGPWVPSSWRARQRTTAREVRHVKVAAMSVPDLLDHVEDGTVFIAPGDRPGRDRDGCADGALFVALSERRRCAC